MEGHMKGEWWGGGGGRQGGRKWEISELREWREWLCTCVAGSGFQKYDLMVSMLR